MKSRKDNRKELKRSERREIRALIADIDTGLREVFRLHKYLMSGVARDGGNPRLNRTHYRTLMLLSRMGPQCMKELCGELGLEAGSFTPVADRLIEEGLTERVQDETDRRRILLSLTALGSETVKRMKKLIRKHIAGKLAALDEKQINQLAESLKQIRNINDILLDGGP